MHCLLIIKEPAITIFYAWFLDPYGRQSGHVHTPLHEMGISPGQDFTAFDILTGRSYIWNQEWNYIELNPYDLPVHLFKIEI